MRNPFSLALLPFLLSLFALLPATSDAQPARKLCNAVALMDCRASCRGNSWKTAPRQCLWLSNRRNRCEINYERDFKACLSLSKGRTACLKKAAVAHQTCNAYAKDWYSKRLSVNNDVRAYCQSTCPAWKGPCVQSCIQRVRGTCNSWWTPLNTSFNTCQKRCRKRHCDL